MRKHFIEKLVKLHHTRPPPRVITWADTTPVADTYAARAPGISFRANHASMMARDVRFFLQRTSMPKAQPGDYAEYFIEDNPDAGVVLRRKDGTMIAHIPLDVWDHAQTIRFDTSRMKFHKAAPCPFACVT